MNALIEQHEANAVAMKSALTAYEAVRDGSEWTTIDARKAEWLAARETFNRFGASPEVRSAIRARIKQGSWSLLRD